MSSEESPIHVSENGISRRRMLKRIGAGAAVAWSAPILTSIRTPAFAQYGCDCPPFNCSSPETCDNGCFCAPHHGNGGPCICWASGFCVPGQETCATDQDCVDQGLGDSCIDINADGCPQCLGSTTACVTTCPSNGPRGRLSGLKAARR